MQQRPTGTEISPRHHTATNKLEPKHTSMICTSFGMWSIGPSKPYPYPQGFTYTFHEQQGIICHVVPLLHVDFWPCVASPTHSKIYLFPPWAAGNDMSYNTLLHEVFCPICSGLTCIFKDLLVSCKVWVSNLTCCHQDKVITNIIAQGQSHIKSSQVQCIQNT